MRLEPLFSVTATMQLHPIGPTPAGTRIDLQLAGDAEEGSRVRGRLEGVDYLTVRPDGVSLLDVHATLRSPDGDVVAVRASGVGAPTPDGSRGRLACTFQTASDKLGWMNAVLAVAATTSNRRTGELRLAAYTLEE
jgi:hypothetical protein